MRLIAALATVTILLSSCGGIGEAEEDRDSGAVAEGGDEQGDGEDGLNQESDEE